MKTPRLYQNTLFKVGETCVLDQAVAHHLFKVLRAGSTQEIILFNGDGQDYQAQVLTDKTAEVKILSSVKNITESKLETTLVQGIAKGEKMDFLIQKAVELGVNRIIPMSSSRCVVKLKGEKADKRLAHWRKIIIHACEQSGRSVVPELLDIHTLDQVLNLNLTHLFVLHHRADQSLSSYPATEQATLLIGPEGGLSSAEIDQALDAGAQPLLLGGRILRTETASLAALANMQLLWGS